MTVGIRNDLVEKTSFNFPTSYEYKPVLKDILKEVPSSVGTQYSEVKKKIFELVPPGGYWRNIDTEIAKNI